MWHGPFHIVRLTADLEQSFDTQPVFPFLTAFSHFIASVFILHHDRIVTAATAFLCSCPNTCHVWRLSRQYISFILLPVPIYICILCSPTTITCSSPLNSQGA